MAHNKVVNQVRFHRRDRRDVHRVEADGAEQLEQVTAGDDPARVAAGRELLAAVRAEMTDEERAIADLRGQGCTWAEVAERLGGTAEARRKQFDRTLDRVSARLGLDEESTHDDAPTDRLRDLSRPTCAPPTRRPARPPPRRTRTGAGGRRPRPGRGATSPCLPPAAVEDALVLIWGEVQLRKALHESPDRGRVRGPLPAPGRPTRPPVRTGATRSAAGTARTLAAGALRPPAPTPPDAPPGYEIAGKLGRGGDGRRVQGPAARAEPDGRPEDDVDGRAGPGRAVGPVPAGGRTGRPPPAPEHRAGVRVRPDRRRTAGVPGDGVRGRADAGPEVRRGCRCRSATPPGWSRPSPSPSTTPTSTASSTAT